MSSSIWDEFGGMTNDKIKMTKEFQIPNSKSKIPDLITPGALCAVCGFGVVCGRQKR
jgi:hypothetical protein